LHYVKRRPPISGERQRIMDGKRGVIAHNHERMRGESGDLIPEPGEQTVKIKDIVLPV